LTDGYFSNSAPGHVLKDKGLS